MAAVPGAHAADAAGAGDRIPDAGGRRAVGDRAGGLRLEAVARRPVLPLSLASFLWLVLTALLGQTIGHGLINASLTSFQPQFVSLMMLWEPILGSLLAFLVLGDRPGPAELMGGAVILAGLALGIVATGRAAPAGAGPPRPT